MWASLVMDVFTDTHTKRGRKNSFMALTLKNVWAAWRSSRVNVFLIHFLASSMYMGSGSPVSQQLCTRVRLENQKVPGGKTWRLNVLCFSTVCKEEIRVLHTNVFVWPSLYTLSHGRLICWCVCVDYFPTTGLKTWLSSFVWWWRRQVILNDRLRTCVSFHSSNFLPPTFDCSSYFWHQVPHQHLFTHKYTRFRSLLCIDKPMPSRCISKEYEWKVIPVKWPVDLCFVLFFVFACLI